MTQKFRVIDPGVEVFDWIDTSNLSALVASFARVHILLSVFDGDPDKWLEMISAEGTAEERDADARFLQKIKVKLADRPALVDDLRALVRDFARLMA
jgi:hypothetical protein